MLRLRLLVALAKHHMLELCCVAEHLMSSPDGVCLALVTTLPMCSLKTCSALPAHALTLLFAARRASA